MTEIRRGCKVIEEEYSVDLNQLSSENLFKRIIALEKLSNKNKNDIYALKMQVGKLREKLKNKSEK